MHQHLLPIFSSFIILILIHSPVSVGAEDELYATCRESFHCANLQNISYPFWGGGRPEFCGYPGFELNCQGAFPLITIISMTYRVIAINSSSRTLTVAREDLLNDTCPRNLYNTTLDFHFFNYVTNDQSVYLYYGCSANSSRPIPNVFLCRMAKSNRTSFFTATSASTHDFVICETSIIVPVNKTAAQALASASASEVDLRVALASGFSLQWMANNTICDRCTQSGGRCGYDPYSSSFACYCADRPHALTCNDVQTRNGLGTSRHGLFKLAIGLSVGFVGIVLVSIATIYKATIYWNRDKGKKQHVEMEVFLRNHGSLAPKQYSYSEIKKITNSFADKLGQGGYGSVYKGRLSDGHLVAVKVLSETKADGEEFINEVASISKTSHVNVVNLLGFCYKRNKRALIYEFMPNGSLDKFIYNNRSPNSNQYLDWNTLYKIAVGIARGLEYLHRGCSTRIVHFDIKPHNILLDEEFFPKISDFGLAKLCARKESLLSMLGARGTPGYIAPELCCPNFGGVSHKSDVYSYGMMVLEMVGGRRNIEVQADRTSEISFPRWIYERVQLEEELGLRGVKNEDEKTTARKMILVGLWCIQTNPLDRPSMTKVMEMLACSIQSLEVPPKPFPNFPTATR